MAITDDLKNLADLKAAGALTEHEFSDAKAALLRGVIAPAPSANEVKVIPSAVVATASTVAPPGMLDAKANLVSSSYRSSFSIVPGLLAGPFLAGIGVGTLGLFITFGQLHYFGYPIAAGFGLGLLRSIPPLFAQYKNQLRGRLVEDGTPTVAKTVAGLSVAGDRGRRVEAGTCRLDSWRQHRDRSSPI